MTLKATVPSLDDVPEGQRDLYIKQSDGSYRLDVEGVEFPEDVAGLRESQQKLLTEKKRLQQELKRFDGVDPDKYREVMEELEELESKEHKSSGNWDAREAQLLEKNQQELDKRDQKISRLTAGLEKALVESVAISAISKAGGSTALLLPHVKTRVRIVEEGDEYVAQVVDAKGNPQIGDAKGNPMTVEQLVDSLKGDPDYGGAFRASGATGSGAANDGKPSGSGKSIAWDDMDAFGENLEAIAKGEVTVAAPS